MSRDVLNRKLAISIHSIAELIPYQNNPRTHSTKQIKQIVRSIQEFGFTNPVLIDDETNVLAGHGRIAAAKEIGMTHVPAIRLSDMTDAQKRAYIIADNKLAENAGWDKNLLKIEFKYLNELNFDLPILGFEPPEIDFFLNDNSNNPDEPKVIIPKRSYSQLGDIWQLGRHRLICGDALKTETFDLLLGDQVADLVFIDPPYNVPIMGHVCSTEHKEFLMASGEMTEEQFIKFLSNTFQNLIKYSANGSIHYICMDWRHIGEVLAAGKYYHSLKNLCVWNKTNGGMGSLYRSKHELIFVYKNGDKPHTNNIELGKNGRYRTNVWDYAGVNSFSSERIKDLADHPTVKPIKMVEDAILDCSKPGQIVLDSFGGSGTTLLAAERTNRCAYVIELDPLYVDVIINRYEKMTGDKAVHQSSNKSFAQIMKDRKVSGVSGVTDG